MDRSNAVGKMLDDLEAAIAGPPVKRPALIDVSHVAVDVFDDMDPTETMPL